MPFLAVALLTLSASGARALELSRPAELPPAAAIQAALPAVPTAPSLALPQALAPNAAVSVPAGTPASAPQAAFSSLSNAGAQTNAVARDPLAAKASLDRTFDRYGAALASPNPVSATTLANGGTVSAIFLDAGTAERGELSAVVKAVAHTPTAVIGRFASADDPFLKPKLDEGLRGAVLDGASSLKETLKFLRRLYLPPLGVRSVGPSDITDYLRSGRRFIDTNNQLFLGGVSIKDARGVSRIDAIVKAKARGLRFVEIDAAALDQAAVAKVEAAANAAGLPIVGHADTRAEADALLARGYAHVVLGGDTRALQAGFSAFADVPLDPRREASMGSRMKDWLVRGLIGHLGFLMSPDENQARGMAQAAHAVWIDAEDGQFPLSKIRSTLAALPPGAEGVVRTTQWDNPDIEAYLQAGAAGVVAPQVATAWQARAFVERVKRANPNALAIVMIETKTGLRNAEEIARAAGIDVLFIGPNDLALSIGAAQDSAEFKAAEARIEAAARAAGVPLGGLAKSRSQAYALHARGYGFVTSVSDQGALHAFYKKSGAGPADAGITAH